MTELSDDFIRSAPIFSGLAPDDVRAMMKCLDAREKHFTKGETVMLRGSAEHRMALVLSGAVHLSEDDFWGRHTLIARVAPGETLGSAEACLTGAQRAWTAEAMEDTDVLFLDAMRVLRTCTNACAFHTRLICNLVAELALGNRRLEEKLACLGRRTLREKLLAFLSAQAEKAGSQTFEIPFTRQELADYLSADRSTLCTELSALQKEGYLETNRRHFTLIRKDAR